MAADDIFRIEANFQAPSGPASWSLYYREVAPQTGPGLGTNVVAEAFETDFGSKIIDCLANDWEFASVICRKMINDPTPMDRRDVTTQQGGRPAPSLPANNALMFELTQSTFPARSNGRIFFPGVSESDSEIGNFSAAFLAGPATALRDQLFVLINEVSGTGTWEPGVISAKVLNAAPPAKDWDGAFAPITNASWSPIVATQRRRQTRVRGFQL